MAFSIDGWAWGREAALCTVDWFSEGAFWVGGESLVPLLGRGVVMRIEDERNERNLDDALKRSLKYMIAACSCGSFIFDMLHDIAIPHRPLLVFKTCIWFLYQTHGHTLLKVAQSRKGF